MNILFLSTVGCSTNLAWRMKDEGHKIKYWIKDKDQKKVGEGFIELVENWETERKWADFIITDDTGFGEEVSKLRKQGFVVWGGDEWADKLEQDRGFAQKEMQRMGIEPTPYHDFNSIQDAIAFISSKPDYYVVKPEGKIQDDKSLTYIGQMEDGKDVIEILNHYDHLYHGKLDNIQLQRRIVGVEVACAGFFNGHDFVEPIEISFEHKHFMPGGTLMTGEMGTTMFWTDKSCPMYAMTIEKMIPLLREHHYVGNFDINCMATEEGLYPLEPTPRYGYPTQPLNQETMIDNLGEAFYELASGATRNLKVKNPIASVVVIATPPHPFDNHELFNKFSKDVPVVFKSGKNPGPYDGIHPSDVYFDTEEKKWLQTGVCGYPVVVTGSGRTIKAALDLMYRRVDSFVIPNMYYRIDIGHSWDEDMEKLRSWGILK